MAKTEYSIIEIWKEFPAETLSQVPRGVFRGNIVCLGKTCFQNQSPAEHFNASEFIILSNEFAMVEPIHLKFMRKFK